MEEFPAVTASDSMAEGKFISLRKLSWLDGHGVGRTWESAERMNFSGAVLIIARLLPSRRLLLIRQYRPPARRPVVEFPAGLANPGEEPEQAALRELREETGYLAENVRVHPPAYTTPGMSDEHVHMVTADIDESRPENRDPQTEFDPSEMIETVLVEEDGLAAFYREECARGVAFDAKLAAYIISGAIRSP